MTDPNLSSFLWSVDLLHGDHQKSACRIQGLPQ
jgi:hypothetical protein